MIIHTYQKSKAKKVPKQVKEQHDQWLKSVNSTKTNFSLRNVKVTKSLGSVQTPYRRETTHYPSLGTGVGNGTKPVEGKVYTGTSMIGIGTLHKSNAVPVFRQEDAVDMAKMRR